MQIMGTNTWETDVPPDMLVRQALKFAEAVKADGIAELRGAWIASDEQVVHVGHREPGCIGSRVC